METVFVSEISYAKARSCFERISAESHFQFTPIAEDEESLAAAISKQGVRAFIADILPYTGELYRCPAQKVASLPALALGMTA